MKEQTIDLTPITIMIAIMLFVALLHISYNNTTISKATTNVGVMQWNSDTCWRGSWNY